MNVISIFSGGGGIDLGFQQAGFEILYSTDFAEAACQTLEHNKVGKIVECKDIREVDFKGLFQRLNVDEIDCLVGGPPCPAYSKSRFYRTEKTCFR